MDILIAIYAFGANQEHIAQTDLRKDKKDAACATRRIKSTPCDLEIYKL